jgi:phosphate transport system permease protein
MSSTVSEPGSHGLAIGSSNRSPSPLNDGGNASALLRPSRANTLDRIYLAVIFVASLAILVLIVGIAVELAFQSKQSLSHFGPGFLTGTRWDPVHFVFGALPFIEGTLYSSFLALLIAVPISVGSAIFLTEISPWLLKRPLAFLIELLAAIPSVVYGLWGILVLTPFLVDHVETPISENHFLSRFPLLTGPANGNDMLCAALILAIMVTPFITSVSRDILTAIPRIAREGSYAVGATKWETIQGVVLPYARGGIIGAVILGLGRALGETMAVTMVIGNSRAFNLSLFSAGNTMSSLIANEFSEASTDLYRSSLVEVALCLFVVTMIVNGAARLLVRYTARDIQTGGRR